MNHASQNFAAAIEAVNARNRPPTMPRAEGINSGMHQPGRCSCDRCRTEFRSDQSIRSRPNNAPIQFPAPAIVRPQQPLTNAQIADKTLASLKGAGQGFYDEINRVLHGEHKMRKAIRPKLLDNIPYLGSCRIGVVPISKEGENRWSVAEFHLTNFDAHLSTERNKQFFSGKSIEEAVKGGALFYGVSVFTDRFGNTIDFDRRNGSRGLYFQTKDKAVAAYAMAGISTGKRLNELKEMDRKNFPNFVNPDK